MESRNRQGSHGFTRRIAGTLRLIAPICAVVAYLGIAVAQQNSAPVAGADSLRLPIGYAGVDYYSPTDYFTHCADFSWLQTACYNNPAIGDPARQQLVSDLNFVKTSHVAMTMRVWVSLDQLMQWDPATGFQGFEPDALANVDDMLSLFHQYGINVVLVLYSYSAGDTLNQFHPESLDGEHGAMRAGYLQAVSEFMQHLAGNETDRETAPFIELQNEPYYQLETYFAHPANLGTFSSCASDGTTDWGCVDQRIIHPWLQDLYSAAKSAAPMGFYYSFSDSGRLFENYAYWSRMYPGDIINEHLYDSTPWLHASLYSRARSFDKPWIVTEAGCASGQISCTYNGTAAPGKISAADVDAWWLNHLGSYGAQSVMVESHVTLWTYPDGPDSQTPTETGRSAIQAVNEGLGPILSSTPTPPATPSPPTRVTPRTSSRIFNNFDHISPGRSLSILGQPHVTDLIGATNLRVENWVSDSAPNAVSIDVSGSNSYVARRPNWSGDAFQLAFDLRIGRRVSEGSWRYLTLAWLRLGNPSLPAANIRLILGHRGRLGLCLKMQKAHVHCAVAPALQRTDRWNHVAVAKRGTALRFSVDGRAIATIRDCTGGAGLHYAAIGYVRSDAAKGQGHLFFDNVLLAR